MVTFEGLVADVLATVRKAETGVDPDRIVFGGLNFEPPSVNVAVFPVSGVITGEAGRRLPATVDVYIHVPGAPEELTPITEGLRIAGAIRDEVVTSGNRYDFGSVQIATLVDTNGTVVDPDRTVILLSFTGYYRL